MKRVECQSLDEVGKLARAFLGTLVSREDGATLVILKGDLGAGKTAFVKETARLLGITEHVTSPTFVIEKRYTLPSGLLPTTSYFRSLVHIDAYRMESAHELEVLGWQELLKEPKTLVMVEWPERVAESIPEGAHVIECEFVNETTRAFTL
ncbi:MAG: tRNA (adenosine(37)-N6)-threonylcarbamoyltransferase complex ATPase subunit type 1 TsaE [Candidatus Campbellbacteria bacterium]|nr:tRNA (adenosine(37)-N6)-threonylcarbamoyltransferase complex ATPase subunit type 1 TsaE [Candidatus Campbellbacteria bacterium]